MEKYPVVKEIQVDPYGHAGIAIPLDRQPDGSLFVARAIVYYEAIAARESYWLRSNNGQNKNYSLWIQTDEGLIKYYCCATLNPTDKTEPDNAARKMLYALWSSRSPIGTVLSSFDKEGILNRKWLAEFTESYHKKLERPKVPGGEKTEFGELFYDDGNLRYRGELWKELAQGYGSVENHITPTGA